MMTRLRSLLFVPGDRPDRMAKAAGLGADALILDLEDAVAPAAKAVAREAVSQCLRGPRPCLLFVRVNPLQSGMIDDDLAAILPAAPDGIVLPKAEGAASLAALDARLTRFASESPGSRALVSIHLANNETGVIQPVAEAHAFQEFFGSRIVDFALGIKQGQGDIVERARARKQIELLKTVPPSLNPYYKQEVNEYFQKIEK